MIKTPSARKRHFVRLEKPKPEDAGEAVALAAMWAAIEPAAPSAFDENKVTHIVTIDYHPDVTLNARFTTEDDRHLWIRGVQDVELQHVELRLLCEEVLTP